MTTIPYWLDCRTRSLKGRMIARNDRIKAENWARSQPPGVAAVILAARAEAAAEAIEATAEAIAAAIEATAPPSRGHLCIGEPLCEWCVKVTHAREFAALARQIGGTS